MSNAKLGNDFEKVIADYYTKLGYFVYRFANIHDGQPSDILVISKNFIYLIDCKTVSNSRFNLDRLRVNQVLAMEILEKNGGIGYFYLFFIKENSIIRLSLSRLLELKKTKKTLSFNDAKKEGELICI